MNKKSILLVLFIISICISCTTDKNSNTALEGTWIVSYFQTSNDANNTFRDAPDYIHLMDFKGNTVRLKSFNSKNSGGYIDTVVNFSLTSNTIKLGNEVENQLKISTDSIVLSSMIDDKMYQTILRKLPKNSKTINWNPTGKHYKTYYDDTEAYFDFTNDSVMYSFSEATSILNTSFWRVENVDNRTILVQNNDGVFQVTYGVVDSLVNDKVYITDYLFQERSQVFEEVNKAYKKSPSLYGTWKLVYKEKLPLDSLRTTVPFSLDNFEKIRISKDSVYFVGKPFTRRCDWKYYENLETILLEKANKTIKVSKVTKDSLILKMDLSEADFLSREYILTRE
ncbi:hypothetical protein KORDIASMS9_00155 [Kordia sp. SMS9]|uniref:hypothetical protein n=1 Tax=Kordia sp. SMS9 TaxID=2282170 RepID=UPI000E0CFDF5|nr:hypothetical protein [Kordia sp. SMS9]AXG67973.1 hypothetical protein KORDIASMS9_00155 [Kordia sp. SMS9]